MKPWSCEPRRRCSLRTQRGGWVLLLGLLSMLCLQTSTAAQGVHPHPPRAAPSGQAHTSGESAGVMSGHVITMRPTFSPIQSGDDQRVKRYRYSVRTPRLPRELHADRPRFIVIVRDARGQVVAAALLEPHEMVRIEGLASDVFSVSMHAVFPD